MTPRSLVRLENSTTGRFISGGVRALDLVAPRLAQRLALDLFLTPQRNRQTPFIVGHRFAIREGAHDLNVWDWGNGPTVLLVHGWNGNAAQLSGFVPPLVRAGYYVAAPDLPGHGSSGGERTNLRDLADAIARVGRRLGPIDAIVAHSFGAAATVVALSEGLDARRVVLIAPPVDLHRYARGFASAVGLSRRSADAMIDLLARKVGSPRLFDIQALAGGLQKGRAVVVHDPADREVPFAEGAALAVTWPGTTLVPLAGVGHSRALRDPTVIARAVSAIADAHAPAALSA